MPLLADDGRVLFVDEHIDERGKEAYVPGSDDLVERQLDDDTWVYGDFRPVR